MLKDITIGQFYPSSSFLHKLDPRTKIILVFVYIIFIFCIQNPAGYILSIIFTTFLYILGKIPLKMIGKSLKPILPILIVTGILNLFFVSQGDPLLHFWIFSITNKGVKLAITMMIRIILLIAGSCMLTYTTLPMALTDGIERLLSPLKKVHFPAHELAMVMTIALRFIPTLIEETEKIIAAQKSRGANLESGGLIKRAKSLTPIFVPLFISSFRRAEDLAMAMEARCYHGGEGRTKLKQLTFSYRDTVATIVVLIFVGSIICLNIFFPFSIF